MKNIKIKIVLLYAVPVILVNSTNITVAYNRLHNSPALTNSTLGNAHGSKCFDDRFLVDTCIYYGPAPSYQGSCGVAFDGNNYLAVWQDYRDSSWDIYCARINPEGVVLDTAGIIVSSVVGDQYAADVIFDGSNYFIVWNDDRDKLHWDIYGARVTTSGFVLDKDGIPISTNSMNKSDPSVAFDGTNYLVAWQAGSGFLWDNDIYAARLTRLGIVIDTTAILVSGAIQGQIYPAVSYDGSNYLIVWEDWRNDGPSLTNTDIFGTRITPEGIVLDSAGICISSDTEFQSQPCVAFDGTNYLVAWQDCRDGFTNGNDIYAKRVSPVGIVLDTGIAVSTAPENQICAAVAFDFSNFIVVWIDYRNGLENDDIYGARISPGGIVLDEEGIPISTALHYQVHPKISTGSTYGLIIWSDSRSGTNSSDLYGARMSCTGGVIDSAGFIISQSANSQYKSALASDSINCLVVWEDGRRGNEDLYGALVDPQGQVLMPSAVPLCTTASRNANPALDYHGGTYLLVWEDGNPDIFASDIYGTRINRNGVALDPTGITISNAPLSQSAPSVASGDSNFFVLWTDSRGGNFDIYGTRVTSSGCVMDSEGIPICMTGWYQEYPSLAFDGNNYLTVWQEDRGGYYYYNNIYGVRVTQAGVVLDSSSITISTAYENQLYPRIAFDGTNYLVVWEDYRNGPKPDIYGARLSISGVVMDTQAIGICTALGSQSFPAIAYNGTDYIITWQDDRNGGSYDIYGARVSRVGMVIDTFIVTPDVRGNQITPAVVQGANHHVLVTYSGWTSLINNRLVNINRIWGSYYPTIDIEEFSRTACSPSHNTLMLYPNPAFSDLTVVYNVNDEKDVIIEVYDITGRLIKRIKDRNQQNKGGVLLINVSDFAQGVYFIALIGGDNTIVRKMIKLK